MTFKKRKKRKILKGKGLQQGLQSDTQNATRGVASSGSVCRKLTEEQAEVLHLLTNELLTIKQISIRRGCSTQAIYKIKKKLKNLGLFSQSRKQNGMGLQKSDVLCNPPQFATPKSVTPVTRQIRLHGQEFNIRLLFKDARYKKARERASLLYVDGNAVRLYRDSVEVYSGRSFYADSVEKATAESMEYFTRLFHRLEHDLSVILIKSRYQNIRLVKQHYAEVGNELAEECEKKADRIRVFAREDGKLWFVVDNSFNLHEAETQHPDTACEDMEGVVRPFFNDLRDNRPPTLSAVMRLLNESVLINKETAAGLNAIVKLLKPVEQSPDQKHISEYIG